MPERCNDLNCPIGELKADVMEVKSDIKALIKQSSELATLYTDISYIRESIKEIKDINVAEHNEMFGRLRDIEKDKASEEDLKEMKTTNSVTHTNIFSRLVIVEESKISKKDVTIIVAIFAVVLTAVEILLKVVMK